MIKAIHIWFFLASVGGTLNLIMGISTISLLEIAYYFGLKLVAAWLKKPYKPKLLFKKPKTNFWRRKTINLK